MSIKDICWGFLWKNKKVIVLWCAYNCRQKLVWWLLVLMNSQLILYNQVLGIKISQLSILLLSFDLIVKITLWASYSLSCKMFSQNTPSELISLISILCQPSLKLWESLNVDKPIFVKQLFLMLDSLLINLGNLSIIIF